MKLANLLFKPKWQDANADVRRLAVAEMRDQALLDDLPELSRSDPDASVRLAALQRLDAYSAWRERVDNDPDDDLRQRARNACLSLLCGAAIDALPLQRRIEDLDLLNRSEIERVAAQAAIAALRRAALTRVERQKFLADRAVDDPDAALRLSLVERISDVSLLERIVERTRKTDKHVSRRARERAQDMRVAAGDSDAASGKALTLCQRIEELLRDPPIDVDAPRADFDRQWQSIAGLVPEPLQRRYRSAQELLAKAQVATTQPPAAQAATGNLPDGAATEHVETPVAEPPATPAPAPPPDSKPKSDHHPSKTAHDSIERSLVELDGLLDAGDMKGAHALHAQIESSVNSQARVAGRLHRHWTLTAANYAELKRTQHWSNMKRRRELCADIQALPASGAHPDAVAARVRDAREEWQHMDLAEGMHDEDAPAKGIAKRFHALCQRALRPARTYFARRKQLRATRAAEVQALLEQTGAVADDCTDWRLLGNLIRQARDALHDLGSVDPRTRGELANRLKTAIARLGDMRQAHDVEVETGKRKLIEQAEKILAQDDMHAAAREARTLQQRWKDLGGGRRSADQRQWREFHRACDAIFKKLDGARRDNDRQLAAAQAQARALTAEFEALAERADAMPEQAGSELRGLDARWRELRVDDRTLAKRRARAVDRIEGSQAQARRRERLKRFTAALERYRLLQRYETGKLEDSAQWQAATGVSAPFDTALDSRFERRHSGPPGNARESESSARETLVRLEFLAGIETPATDKRLRMNFQVQRLAERMREGTAATSPEQELEALMLAWFSQDACAPGLELRFANAADAAIQALP